MSPAAAAGAVALRFFDSRGMDQERVDALPNDAVVSWGRVWVCAEPPKCAAWAAASATA